MPNLFWFHDKFARFWAFCIRFLANFTLLFQIKYTLKMGLGRFIGVFQGRRAPRGAHLLAAESAAKEVLPAHFILSFELMEVTT